MYLRGYSWEDLRFDPKGRLIPEAVLLMPVS